MLLSRSPWAPPGPTLTRSIVPATRSKTKASATPLVSPGARLVAALAKATVRPSADRAGAVLGPSPGGPAPWLVRTSIVVPALRSRTKTSATSSPLVSPATSVWAADRKATTPPSPLSDGADETPSVWAPPGPTLTRVVVLATRS